MIPPSPGRTAASAREAGAGPAPTPQPPDLTGTTENKRTRANAPGRHTDRARRRQASTNRSGMGATPSVARATPVTPAFLPAQGRQRDGPRQGNPPPHWPPRQHSRRARRTGRPPPPPHAGRQGGNGEDTKPGTGPSPPNRPRAPRTYDQGTAPAKAVVAHCATPEPQGQAASVPAHGGPTGDKPVAQARQCRGPGRPRIRGATQWVSARSHGCKLMH